MRSSGQKEEVSLVLIQFQRAEALPVSDFIEQSFSGSEKAVVTQRRSCYDMLSGTVSLGGISFPVNFAAGSVLPA